MGQIRGPVLGTERLDPAHSCGKYRMPWGYISRLLITGVITQNPLAGSISVMAIYRQLRYARTYPGGNSVTLQTSASVLRPLLRSSEFHVRLSSVVQIARKRRVAGTQISNPCPNVQSCFSQYQAADAKPAKTSTKRMRYSAIDA
jgi:hypothetical protein